MKTGLLFAYLVFFPFGQLVKLPLQLFKSPEINLYLTDVLVFLLLLSWGIWRLFLKKKKYHLPLLAFPLFLFSGICCLSLGLATSLLSCREMLVSSLYLLRWLVYAGFYFVINDLKSHFAWLKWKNMVNFLIAVGAVALVFGFVQYFLWPDLKALEVMGWDPHYYRIVGTFLDPAFTGMIFVLTMILVLEKWLESSGRTKQIFFFLAALIYLGLILTYSRASYLAYLIGAGVIFLKRKKPRLLLTAVLILILTLIFIPKPAGEGGRVERTFTLWARLENWQQALLITKDHPFFGVGFNAYRYVQKDYGFLDEDWQISHAGAGVDSSFLFVLATTGIIGLMSFIWLWIKIFKLAPRPILASLAAIAGHSLFNNTFFYPWVLGWMIILLAYLEEKVKESSLGEG